MPDIQDLIGKRSRGPRQRVQYVGTPVEVSDTEVHLKGLMQWLPLPASSVVEIKLKGAVKREPEREGGS